MTNPASPPHISLFVAAGMGAGALTGLVIGLLVHRPTPPVQEVMAETVDDLKRRAEMILTELSKDHVPSDPD